VGHLSSKGKLECSIKRRKVPVITVAWYAHYGKWREDLTVADGDPFNLKIANIMPLRPARRRKQSRCKPDHLTFNNGRAYLGGRAVPAQQASVLLRLASARVYDFATDSYVRAPVSRDEIESVLWPGADGGPLGARAVIGTLVCRLNRALTAFRIVPYRTGHLILKEL
jgi:hypothetical protein